MWCGVCGGACDFVWGHNANGAQENVFRPRRRRRVRQRRRLAVPRRRGPRGAAEGEEAARRPCGSGIFGIAHDSHARTPSISAHADSFTHTSTTHAFTHGRTRMRATRTTPLSVRCQMELGDCRNTTASRTLAHAVPALARQEDHPHGQGHQVRQPRRSGCHLKSNGISSLFRFSPFSFIHSLSFIHCVTFFFLCLNVFLYVHFFFFPSFFFSSSVFSSSAFFFSTSSDSSFFSSLLSSVLLTNSSCCCTFCFLF